MSNTTSRRRVLRGLMNGSAINVAIPFLECFLNGNGDALADGSPIPTRFGTWFWGLGVVDQIFLPKKVGHGYELTPQIASFEGVNQHINLYTNFDVMTDGRPNFCHYTGWVSLRCGEAPQTNNALPHESIDVTVADVIGASTRFPSITLTATGDPRASYSFRSADAVNPPDPTPQDFYARIFGSEFQDPNSPVFTPDPRIMVRKSTLSAVTDQAASLRKTLGKADQARLDEYFTATRALENRLALQLQKPPPAPACKIPEANQKMLPAGVEVETLAARHSLMVDLLVMALACNQTRVFNMSYSHAFASTTRKGIMRPHHSETHEESVDQKLGYQPNSAWFSTKSLEAWAYLVKAMANFKEGDGTLLDHSLVYAHSDQHLARVHQITGIPMMTAGSAGGKLKTGYHIDGANSPGTRVGLTAMQAMGLQVTEWGVNSMKTSHTIGDVVA